MMLTPAIISMNNLLVLYEDKGLSLVSGGPPDKEGEKGVGGCRTGEGESGSGLWIFTREQVSIVQLYYSST